MALQALGMAHGLGLSQGLAVPADIAANIARKTELHGKCKILGIPFDPAGDLDELGRRCRLAASGGIPTCVDDLPAEKRAEVIGQIALMNAAGVPVSKHNFDALMREQPFQRFAASAQEMRETFRQLARLSNAWPKSVEQRDHRRARNKRKRDRRARRGK
jgi:hypothetical protein